MAFFTSLLFIVGLIVLFVFSLGATLLGAILRLLFGSKRKSSFGGRSPFGSGTNQNRTKQQSQYKQQGQQSSGNQSPENNAGNHHKVFGSDEGDYVDFEEVDDV